MVAACAVLAVGDALSQPTETPLLVAPTDTGPVPNEMGTEGFVNDGCVDCPPEYEASYGDVFWLLPDFELRHSSSHGRAMGPGGPLRGTSWLNRPYDVTLEYGALLMTKQVAQDVRKNNDLFGALKLGWDWDHYWGSQIRFGWSTPDLVSTQQSNQSNDDNLFITDISMLYYPWGDSRLRPYWRMGVGLTDLEYTNFLGARQHEMLLTIPFGVGIKHQFRRWLVWRLEFMDNFAVGQNETSSLHNLTITTGLEWRFGGRPSGYWAWSGRGGAW